MGDNSLDSFFAKKDKSKKNKKNYLTPEELAKQLEEYGKGGERKRKDKDKGGNDEEWKDFEDEKEKDYRGLKIQSLNIRDKEEEMREQQKLQENGGNNKSDEASGPWKRSSSPAPQQSAPEEPSRNKLVVKKEKEEEELSSKEPSSSSGNPKAYVPPHLRGGRSAGSGDSSGSGSGSSATLQPMAALLRKPKSSRPQINDEQDFPSLGD